MGGDSGSGGGGGGGLNMLVGLRLNYWIQPHKTLAHKMRFTSTLLNFLDYIVAVELGASSAASGSPGKPIIRAIRLCTQYLHPRMNKMYRYLMETKPTYCLLWPDHLSFVDWTPILVSARYISPVLPRLFGFLVSVPGLVC